MSETNGPVRILFVCMGNICRSPSAENVMRTMVDREGLSGSFEIDSAGTISLHSGNPPDDRMTRAAERRGIEMPGAARQIHGEDFGRFDWILVMDEENRTDVEWLAKKIGGGNAKIAMFCDFCTGHDETEVPDPYYGGEEGFETVLDLLEDGCSEIVRRYRVGELQPG